MKQLILIAFFLNFTNVDFGNTRERALPTNMFSSLSMSPDGNSFVVTDTGLYTDDVPGATSKSFSPSVYLIQIKNKEQIEKLNFISLNKERLLDPAFISKNEIVVAQYPSQILIWNLTTKGAPKILNESASFAQVKLLTDRRLLLIKQSEVGFASLKMALEYWINIPFSYQSMQFYSGDISPSKKLILLNGHHPTKPIIFWDVNLAKEIWSPNFTKGAGGHVAAEFLSDTRAIIAGSKVQILNLEDKKVTLEFPKGESSQSVYSHAVSSDKKLLCVGSGNEVIVWDLENGTEVAKIPGFSGEVVDINFLRDANQLIAMDRYKIEIWNFRKKIKIYSWTLSEFSKH